jgi:TatA/E family protein of Tat protein translocase
MPQLGPLEILVIFVVALLVFGPSKLPEIGRQVGRGVSEFRKFQHSLRQDLDGMFGHDDHDDVSAGAQPAPTLPPREPRDWTEPPDQPQLGDGLGDGSETGLPAASGAATTDPDESADPMLPLPWPDAVPAPPPPPPPPPPDDSPPVDQA